MRDELGSRGVLEGLLTFAVCVLTWPRRYTSEDGAERFLPIVAGAGVWLRLYGSCICCRSRKQ